jgi:hypothetical protein
MKIFRSHWLWVVVLVVELEIIEEEVDCGMDLAVNLPGQKLRHAVSTSPEEQ